MCPFHGILDKMAQSFCNSQSGIRDYNSAVGKADNMLPWNSGGPSFRSWIKLDSGNLCTIRWERDKHLKVPSANKWLVQQFDIDDEQMVGLAD